MLIIVGAVVVVACVLGGYAAMGGHLVVLMQPFELVIIGGAAIGAFIIANPKVVLVRAGRSVRRILKGSSYDKESYVELLSVLYQLFKLAKTKGMLALESHVENPAESSLFQQFPSFAENETAMTFLCDYLRMLTLGTENPHEVEALIDEELETHHSEYTQVSSAIQTMADGLPALGIVAAVLGVIKTMGAITEPPEVLGQLIGGALVGTFLGVFLSYGFVGPMANAIKALDEAEMKYLQCIRAGLLAHMQGYAPAVSVEFARKALLQIDRPTFYEVEEAVQALPPV
ncbi:flagellar motor stator protein MotA [Rhodospirillaceae bacterium SYSU D60014]|uniref:flagellar motor stator protein MotA n=1 Tax=Virgifigura deserti TaxID=2268457 RepID=UPI000E65FDCE